MRPLPRPDAVGRCYTQVVEVRGARTGNDIPAIFDLPHQHGYTVHITVFSDGMTDASTPVFTRFHITWGWGVPGLGHRAIRYEYKEAHRTGPLVAYEENVFGPLTDRGFRFIHPAHDQILKAASANLARELTQEINLKFAPTPFC